MSVDKENKKVESWIWNLGYGEDPVLMSGGGARVLLVCELSSVKIKQMYEFLSFKRNEG